MSQLWIDTRVGFLDVWGIPYSPAGPVDDLSNLKPLQFAHQVQDIRSRIWSARTSTHVDGAAKYKTFMEKLMMLQKVSLQRVMHQSLPLRCTERLV